MEGRVVLPCANMLVGERRTGLWNLFSSIFATVVVLIFIFLAVMIFFAFLSFDVYGRMNSRISEQKARIKNISATLDIIQSNVTNAQTFINEVKPCLETVCEAYFDNQIFPCWDAFDNNPMLISSILGNNSQGYIVCEPGNTTLNGQTNWKIGDLSMFGLDSLEWIKIGDFIGNGSLLIYTVETFDTSQNFTVPFGVTEIMVYCQGGGGGGASGGGGNSGTGGAGAGGGVGDYQFGIRTVSPGDTLMITVGMGGIGGSATPMASNGTDGTEGGPTLVEPTVGIPFCASFGGSGGRGGDVGPLGAGGSGVSGRSGSGGGAGSSNSSFGGLGIMRHDGEPGGDVTMNLSAHGGNGAPLAPGQGGIGGVSDLFNATPTAAGGGGSGVDVSIIGIFDTGGAGADGVSTDIDPNAGATSTQPGVGGGGGGGGFLTHGGGGGGNGTAGYVTLIYYLPT